MVWKQFKLGETCDIIKGTASAANEVPGEFPLVVTAAERKTAQHFQFEGEAVCIPLVSSTGHGNAAINRLHYETGKFSVASILAAVLPKTHEISCKFLFYYLTALKEEILVPLMKGTSNVSLTVKKLESVEISAPSLDEQRKIVFRIDDVHSKLRERQIELAAVECEANAMLFNAFQDITDGVEYMPLSKVAPLVRRPIEVQFNGKYPELGVRSFGKGTFHKPMLTGADVGNKRLFEIHAGDLLFNIVFAWEGAIAVPGAEDHGRVGSHRFLTCVPQPGLALAEFLRFYLLTPEGLQKVGEASPGGAGRNRTLGIKKAENIHVPIPEMSIQRRFGELCAQIDQVRAIRASTAKDTEALIPAMLHEIFGSQTNKPEAASRGNILQLPAKQKIVIDTPFKEAVLVGAIVKAFHEDNGQPIGNFRLQKAVYFARRQMGESALNKDYLRKAAGPYNPKMRYSGGIKIAADKDWIKRASGKYGESNALGNTIAEMDEWVDRYQFAPAAAWVRDRFKYKSNDLWEALATVDYAMLALEHDGVRPTPMAILSYIEADNEWRPKIEKLSLTKASIQNIMVELESLFAVTGGTRDACVEYKTAKRP
ncbi:MAG: restriction endonuclease subunit S [Pseudomonadota bacterium]